MTHLNLAAVARREGRLADAVAECRKALTRMPDLADAHLLLGDTLRDEQRVDEAHAEYREAMRLDPRGLGGRLGLTLLALPGPGEVIQPPAARPSQPRSATADEEFRLAQAAGSEDRIGDAIAHYDRALSASPDWPEASNNLAWLLSTAPDAKLRDGERAMSLALAASEATDRRNPIMLDTLAAALAETGRFGPALTVARAASTEARAGGRLELAAEIDAHVVLLAGEHPLHAEDAPPPGGASGGQQPSR
jgi:tetratricopeptide (TPR) repeat protein